MIILVIGMVVYGIHVKETAIYTNVNEYCIDNSREHVILTRAAITDVPTLRRSDCSAASFISYSFHRCKCLHLYME